MLKGQSLPAAVQFRGLAPLRRILELLIVDDDPRQAELLRLTVEELGLPHHCHYASSGSLALDFLHGRPPFEDAPRPHLILLDVNMPGMSGYEVLQTIKSDSRFRSIPTIMLSSSESWKDIQASYARYANAYIHKPDDLDGNLKVVRELDRFWCSVASLAE